MDWLEECAERLKRYLRNASMVRAAAVYLLISALGCMACIGLTMNLTSLWIAVMSGRFPYPGRAIWLMQGIRQLGPYVWIAAFLAAAGRLFLEHKVKAAVSEARRAIRHMAAGDLSYEMAWQSEDELGLLVKDVEDLREMLKREKRHQWEMSEDQRRVNAAFAHDIRTPLTVMKGYTEFLKKYVPQGKVTEQELIEKLDRIARQGDRLLAFSGTMTRLQKMESREVRCKWFRTAEICRRIREAAEGMAREGILISFSENGTPQGNLQGDVLADLDLILEAVENVLQNAFRYAREKIEVTVQYGNGRLTVYVRDDGEGFSEKALREAAAVYFREEREGEEEGSHFGIGLSIAQSLCEKHGGELKLFNSVEGGAVAAVSFLAG